MSAARIAANLRGTLVFSDPSDIFTVAREKCSGNISTAPSAGSALSTNWCIFRGLTQSSPRECPLSQSPLEDGQAGGDIHEDIVVRIKADAPVLRPDEPTPPNPVL